MAASLSRARINKTVTSTPLTPPVSVPPGVTSGISNPTYGMPSHLMQGIGTGEATASTAMPPSTSEVSNPVAGHVFQDKSMPRSFYQDELVHPKDLSIETIEVLAARIGAVMRDYTHELLTAIPNQCVTVLWAFVEYGDRMAAALNNLSVVVSERFSGSTQYYNPTSTVTDRNNAIYHRLVPNPNNRYEYGQINIATRSGRQTPGGHVNNTQHANLSNRPPLESVAGLSGQARVYETGRATWVLPIVHTQLQRAETDLLL